MLSRRTFSIGPHLQLADKIFQYFGSGTYRGTPTQAGYRVAYDMDGHGLDNDVSNFEHTRVQVERQVCAVPVFTSAVATRISEMNLVDIVDTCRRDRAPSHASRARVNSRLVP